MQGGVLPSQAIAELVHKKAIEVPAAEKHIQPNSIDLPLGARCWRLRSIRVPRKNETVSDIIEELAIDELNLEKGCLLERNAVYVAELACALHLPADVHGDCDAKSSTGRIDIQVRTLTDGSERYDHVPAGYTGKLYLFMSSNSFLVRIKTGLSLNQLRLTQGHSVIDDASAQALVREQKLIYVAGLPLTNLGDQKGIFMHLDLKRPIAGYRAKFTNTVLDLSRSDNPTNEFWEPISGPTDSITLERGQFYILSTLEHIRLPHTHCSWIPPFHPEFGEFRSHYAGFIDSGWGYGMGERLGDTITLEVRSQDNSLTLLHGSPVCPLLFMVMKEVPDKIYSVHVKSNYALQSGPRLSKYFS